MDAVIVILDVLERLGVLAVGLIGAAPNSEQLKSEAMARLARLQAMLSNDTFAQDLQDELDKAVPPPPPAG